MRLDPVYVLAPESPPAELRGFTRRAWLVGSCAALVAGFSGGYLAGRLTAPTPAAVDPMLKWALEVQRGGASDLIAGAETFLLSLTRFDDRRLVEGLDRIATIVVDGKELSGERRRVLASLLVPAIEQWPPAASLVSRLPVLRALGK